MGPAEVPPGGVVEGVRVAGLPVRVTERLQVGLNDRESNREPVQLRDRVGGVADRLCGRVQVPVSVHVWEGETEADPLRVGGVPERDSVPVPDGDAVGDGEDEGGDWVQLWLWLYVYWTLMLPVRLPEGDELGERVGVSEGLNVLWLQESEGVPFRLRLWDREPLAVVLGWLLMVWVHVGVRVAGLPLWLQVWVGD